MAGGLELGDLQGPFQPKPSYEKQPHNKALRESLFCDFNLAFLILIEQRTSLGYQGI